MENNIRTVLQENLNYYIRNSQMSQKDIAEKLGVSKGAITNWLNGSNSPNMEVLANLCVLLGVKMSEMLSDRSSTSDLSENEKKLLDNFKQLNEKGQNKLVRVSEFMLEDPDYLKESDSTQTVETLRKA